MAYRRIRLGKRGRTQRIERWTVFRRCARSLFYEPLEDRRLLAIILSSVEDGSQVVETAGGTSDAITSSEPDYAVDIAAVSSETGGSQDGVEVVSDAIELNVGLGSTIDSTAVDGTFGGIDGGSDGGSDSQPTQPDAGSADLSGGGSDIGSTSQDSGSSSSVETDSSAIVGTGDETSFGSGSDSGSDTGSGLDNGSGSDSGSGSGSGSGGGTSDEPFGMSVPQDLTGSPGSSVTVPFRVAGDLSGLSMVEIVLAYDTTLLDTTADSISAGDLWPTATVVADVDEVHGQISVTLYGTDPVETAGTGSLFNIEFVVSESAPVSATTPIDLQLTSANQGLKPMVPLPQAGSDPTDGLITISSPPPTGRIDVSLTASPSVPDPRTGEAARVPASLDWVDEWGSFVVGIWASSMGNVAAAMGGASVLLTYDTNIFSAVDVKFGPAFVGHTQEIDDASGRINLEAMTSVLDIGVGRPTLLAQVRFAATEADPGVGLLSDRESTLAAHDLKLTVEDAYIDFIGRRASDPVVGRMPHTKVIPVVYDVDHNNRVSMADFSYFAAQFMGVGTNVGSDFDVSGAVNFTDFSWFAANFGMTRSDENGPTYPEALVDYWMGRLPPPATFALNDGQPSTAQSAPNGAAAATAGELPVADPEPLAPAAGQPEAEVSATSVPDDPAAGSTESGAPLEVVVRTLVLLSDEFEPADAGAPILNVTVATVPLSGSTFKLQYLPGGLSGTGGLYSPPATVFQSPDATDDLDLVLTWKPFNPTAIDGAFAAAK